MLTSNNASINAFKPGLSSMPLGLSADSLDAIRKREQAAITMCGGLLGACFLMSEVADYMMTEAIAEMTKCKWFKLTIKQSFKEALRQLRKNTSIAVCNSPSKHDYMREMADNFYSAIKGDIFRMEQAVSLYLGKHKVKDSQVFAKALSVDMVLRLILAEYNGRVNSMCNLYGDKSFYDSWYSNASAENVIFWWSKGINLFANAYIDKTINLNDMPEIENGINIIRARLNDDNVNDHCKELTVAECGTDDEAMSVFREARSLLTGVKASA